MHKTEEKRLWEQKQQEEQEQRVLRQKSAFVPLWFTKFWVSSWVILAQAS